MLSINVYFRMTLFFENFETVANPWYKCKNLHAFFDSYFPTLEPILYVLYMLLQAFYRWTFIMFGKGQHKFSSGHFSDLE